MTTYTINVQQEMSLPKVLGVIFIPSSLLTVLYLITGGVGHTIPSLLIFYIWATLILFPIELGVVLYASKKEYGNYSLKSAFAHDEKMSGWKIFLYGALLFAFAGLMSATLAPLENSLFAPISNKLIQVMPAYFEWNNMEYYKQYSKDILLLTCVAYFILNVFVGPIIEELFFRGYLTSKISRYGNFAPLIITVLFSLYHLWLPFGNLFRISKFFPAAWLAWKKKSIYISIVFHCLCNLLSTVSFIMAVYAL
ncbi:MAG TPA: CPBP family intramembrane glutamic endopeptidase [Clostridiaceae bacterium]|nr:CPBP family intramembrane glutamic endopeptidase [Clostridiaceae bacterium]